MSLLQLAQQLGEQLAHSSLSRQGLHHGKHDNYACIQIIPYKHHKDDIGSRFAVLRSLMHLKCKIYFGIVGNKHEVILYASLPKQHIKTLESSLYTNIGTIDITDYERPPLSGVYYAYCGEKGKEHFFTDQELKRDGLYLDPLASILSLFEQIEDQIMHISYCFYFGVEESFLKKAGGLFVKHMITPLFESESKKPQDTPEQQEIQVSIAYHLSAYNDSIAHQIQSRFQSFLKSGSFKRRKEHHKNNIQLNQAINLFHLPSNNNQHYLKTLNYRKLNFPAKIPLLSQQEYKHNLTVIGKTDSKGQELVFGIKPEDKLRHMYIIGKTGAGKSKLIANLAKSDMISNKGLCVIDPHGDLIDDIISQVPSHRINDIVLFDVADRERPVGFNILEHDKPEEKPLIASSIISIFKKLYDHSRGPRLEYILRNVILSILEYPNASLLHLIRMLTDKNFREEVLEYVKDPVIMKFWRDEFDAWPDKQREEAISPISNKVGQFTSSQIIRNIFGQAKGKINFRKLMDEGKIVLINLSKGKIGEDNTNLLGSFIVSKIQIDAMSRADIDEDQRKEFYLYIDEFQNFATESFATILSEARKYKLGLILANQYSAQLDEVTRGAIFGNVGSIIAMTLGYDDAVIMSQQFKSMVSANDFLDLPKYKAYIKLMIDGIVSDPFSMQTINPPQTGNIDQLKDKIRQQSRSRYAISRAELEELISVRAERSFSKTEKAVIKAQEKRGNKAPKEVNHSPQTAAKNDTQDAQHPTSSTTKEQTSIATEKQTQEHSASSDQVHTQHQIETTHTTHEAIQEYKGVIIGKTYEGYVKLKFNYGLFVLVGEAEGLLHKKSIDCPDGINWKKLYEIGDPIIVKAEEIKEIDDRTTVVRTQL